ncbi:hypothetical protein N1851_030812 [Merluccius polli]|uniref:Alkylated DNA repair protein AlkB homologue 8 N-terminal domain-containing protein n=1 Tax=Merluccius polli TaxID=89951 RepID=A0AA47M4U3_MERPO|nr:hypothetical protein N1851_030812 [Merluccius polli]
MCLDKGLSHQPTPDCETWPPPLLHPHAEHRLPTGLCAVGCVLLYCLYTHDCCSTHNNNLIVKFADNTTVVGLIPKGDEAAYREEVLKLAAWCSENNLALNTKKTRSSKHSTDPAPLCINGECVERAHTFRFLGVLISADISWSENITAVIKKAQQRLHFLRVLRKYNLNSNLLLTLPLIHREPADILHHSVVWQLHCCRQGEAPESRKGSSEDHWLPSPLTDGHLHLPLPQQSQNHHHRDSFDSWHRCVASYVAYDVYNG